MTLWVLGLNHQTAPVDLRERVAFDAGTVPHALSSLRALPDVAEAALLSTCNRTELYAVAEDGDVLSSWLATHAEGLEGYLYRHRDADAVRHLFRVATGLDSMVLGEPQILGQVKDAWATAREHGALGNRLDRPLQQTCAEATRPRTDTRLAAKHLSEGRVRRLLVANRTLAHAQDLASRHGGYALPLAELDRHLAEADVVFSATAAREPVVRHAQVAAALAARRHKPMLLFDLAVPRDIDASVADLRDAYLYTVDDLERAVEDNRRSRREAADAAEAIIDVQVGRFMESLRAGAHTEPLKRLRALGEATREDVLAKARQQLANGREPEQVLDFLAHTLTNRLLHPPTAALREAALNGDADLARAADRLFPAQPPYSHLKKDDDANAAP